MIWANIIRWLTGGGLKGLAEELRKAQRDRLAAENDKQRLAAQERVETIMLQMQAQTRGSATWLPKVMRALWTVPFVIYTGKVIVWDKVLGWGVTDPLGVYEQNLGLMIAGFYFLQATLHGLRR